MIAGELRSGLVDGQRTASKKSSVQGLNSLFGLAVIRHFQECETAGLAGIAIPYEVTVSTAPWAANNAQSL